MNRGSRLRRRGFVAGLTACPISLASLPSQAQPRQLELASYFLGPTLVGKGIKLFAEKATEDSAGTIQISVELVAPTMPFQMISKASALAHYYPADSASIEPVLGLATLPMLVANFDEAETLLRIARPYYVSVLARYGQILLATEPWRPVALWSSFPIRSAADFKGASFAQAAPFGERAGWAKPFLRLGARYTSFHEAEVVLSAAVENVRLTREFAYVSAIFFVAQLNFLTVGRETFDSLTEAQRALLVTTGQETERILWSDAKARVLSEQQDIAAQGVVISEQPSADLLATLRVAAEPDIADWVRTMGADGAALLAEYRRVIGRG